MKLQLRQLFRKPDTAADRYLIYERIISTRELDQSRTKKKGKPRELLTKKQLSEIIQTINEKSPPDFGYETVSWTTGAVGAVIGSGYKVKYKSKTAIYLIFKRAKFTFHKPDRLYQARDEKEVQTGKNEAKIEVNQALLEKETVVLAADEMSLSTQTTTQKIWLPEGEYPQVKVASKREARSSYGFLDIRNGSETAFKSKGQNMSITYEILGKLRKVYPSQKLFLIWDKAPGHKGSKAQQFIKEDGKIETFDFPRAAPQHYPQEHVWKNGSSKVSQNRFIENRDQATDEFVEYLNSTTFNYSFPCLSAES